MSIFTNSFFSWEGQKERLANVGNTLLAAVTGKGVKSNTGVKPLDTALSAAASHPFTTAAVVATMANPTAALNAAKTVGASAKTSFVAASAKTKAAVIVGGVVAAPIIASKPKQTIEAVATAPSKIASFETDLYKLAKEPSLANAKALITENKAVSALVGGAVVALAAPIVAEGASAAATYLNTKATRTNTEITAQNTNLMLQDLAESDVPMGGAVSPMQTSYLTNPALASPTLTQVGKPASKSTSSTPKRRRSRAGYPSINNRLSLSIDGRKQNIYNKQVLLR